MFGYIQSFCDEVIKTLNATSGLMKGDVGSYKTQVETLKAQAEQLKAKAQDILSHLPIMKTITTTSTDDKGNQVEDEKQVVDDAATSAAQGEAATAQAEAETATQNAISLETLISALLAQLASLASMILGFNNANEAAQAATRNSTNLLVAGASMIGKVISVFNVPEAKNVGDWAKGFGNNVLKTFVGVDLSDGIDTDEVNKIAGIVVDTGATVVSGFTSIVVGSVIASTPIGGTGLASLAVGAVRGGTNLLLNLGRDTAAKAVSGVIVSGLNFFGIEVKEPEKKEDETKVDTDGVNEALEGKQDEMEAMKDTTEKKTGESTAGTAGNTVIADGVGQGNSNNKPKYTAEELKAAQDDVDRLQKELDFAISQRDYAKGRIDAENEKIKKANEELRAARVKRDYAQTRMAEEDKKITEYRNELTNKLTPERRNEIENELKFAHQRRENDSQQYEQAKNAIEELDKAKELAGQRKGNDRRQYGQAIDAIGDKGEELDSAKAKLAEISNNV